MVPVAGGVIACNLVAHTFGVLGYYPAGIRPGRANNLNQATDARSCGQLLPRDRRSIVVVIVLEVGFVHTGDDGT